MRRGKWYVNLWKALRIIFWCDEVFVSGVKWVAVPGKPKKEFRGWSISYGTGNVDPLLAEVRAHLADMRRSLPPTEKLQ